MRISWPGNVRELRNRMERAVALAPRRWIMPAICFPEAADRSRRWRHESVPLAAVRDAAERRQIERALAAQWRGQIAEAAARLGHLAHHHVGEDAPPRHRGRRRHLSMFGFPNIGSAVRPDFRTTERAVTVMDLVQ